ncbi:MULTISPECIES: hypothetical protein [Acinetobacter]|uniref:Uncharacterized protein n=1 Tax=Acinetobacter chengduensis TaxID=2420890 RepID=A0ABX9TRK0_9GAMM|nr:MULTISPECIES: hypothetical protein [Acinetobacter]MBI1452982.1 hypothetical protein [Acinetobacter sp. FL51]RLL16534.1 hypothetical protein D9K81_18110 [Acinetobacter chengduensis]
MNTHNKPFRKDLGLDDAGFHRIRMGNTVYCVKNNVIYILSADGRLTQVDESTLSAKSWIRRNVNEVLGQNLKFKAHFAFKSRRGYVIEVNGIQYTARVTTDPTSGLDSYASTYAPMFSFRNLLVNDNGVLRTVTESEVNHPEFQRVFKACLNARRRSDCVAQRHNLNRWNSRHECEQYKIKKNNTDAFGRTFN